MASVVCCISELGKGVLYLCCVVCFYSFVSYICYAQCVQSYDNIDVKNLVTTK